MYAPQAGTTLHELVFRVIPNLDQAKTLVLDTLQSLIENADDPLELLKRREQKERFTLEVYRLRLSLEAILQRHQREVDALLDDAEHRTTLLVLEKGEAATIDEAIAIYRRVRDFQRGERRSPLRH